MATAVLYTPQVLALAVDLASYPFEATLPFVADARSATCGSQLRLGLDCDAKGSVTRVGVSAQACAVGQAAAGLFVKAALGQDLSDMALARERIRTWLAGEGPLPDWPGFEALSAVPAYPARHGAVLLSWNAAIEALSSGKQ